MDNVRQFHTNTITCLRNLVFILWEQEIKIKKQFIQYLSDLRILFEILVYLVTLIRLDDTDLPHSLNNSIVSLVVLLGSCRVFGLDLIEHFPVVKLEVMSALVLDTPFISESTFHIPTDQPFIVVTQLFQCGVYKLSALCIAPVHLVRVIRIGNLLGCLEQPGRHCTEVDDHFSARLVPS